MCKVISICNQKGGVAKTTTAVNLGIGLAKEGNRVCLVDCDAQGSMTIALGYKEPDRIEVTLATLLSEIMEEEEVSISDAIIHQDEGVDLIPANIDLAALEINLVNAMSREVMLRMLIESIRSEYDYIIIDCAPSLGMMTINALACADSVLIPAIVKEYSDDEAVLAMVDSNLQREEILPSEKAFAYKMRYEAMRRKAGRRSKNNSSQLGTNYSEGRADIALAEEVGESRNQVHRFMRLTELIPSILDLVDRKIVAIVTAVEISYLTPDVQEMLYEYMKENGECKAYQIYALREYLKDNGKISRLELIRILNENAPRNETNKFQKITISTTKLKEYFPTFYTRSQIENVLFKLLEDWKKENGDKEG